MTEVYRYSTNSGILPDVPGVVTKATFTRFDVKEEILSPSIPIQIPYAITESGGPALLTIEYTYGGSSYVSHSTIDVVSPLFRKDDLLSWDADFSMLSDQAIIRLERTIREVIEALTNQRFDYYYDELRILGSGSRLLALPQRLVRSSTLSGDAVIIPGTAYRAHDGWAIEINGTETWLDSIYTNPIRDPWSSSGVFVSGKAYFIRGFFGYDDVPNDIILAALLLAQDYGCDQSLWRDRYLDNMRSADWRVEFAPQAFVGTGNVKVDQILAKYYRIGISVI